MNPKEKELTRLMSQISHAAFAAEWMDGLEYALWRIAVLGGGKYGDTFVEQEQAKMLLQLAAQTRGWIIFDDETEETPIPLSEWLSIYAESGWLRSR